jgi:hypothetical protein
VYSGHALREHRGHGQSRRGDKQILKTGHGHGGETKEVLGAGPEWVNLDRATPFQAADCC